MRQETLDEANRAVNAALDKQACEAASTSSKPLPELAADRRYKTRLCVNWADTGACRYGTRCHFAHGEGELRLRGAAADVAADRRAEAIAKGAVLEIDVPSGVVGALIGTQGGSITVLQQEMGTRVAFAADDGAPQRTVTIAGGDAAARGRTAHVLRERAEQLAEARDAWPPADLASAYECPITAELMRFPALAADGHTYERHAIQAWLAHSRTSPVTNEPLESVVLVPNRAVHGAIRSLLRRHPHLASSSRRS